METPFAEGEPGARNGAAPPATPAPPLPPGTPAPRPLRWTPLLVAAVLAAAGAAVGALWLGSARGGGRFAAPGVLQVVPAAGVGVGRLFEHGGLVRSASEQEAVFAWLTGPVEIEVERPLGLVALRLGRPDRTSAELRLADKGGVLVRREAGRPLGTGAVGPWSSGRRFALRHDGARYLVLVDGAVVHEQPGPPPEGAAGLHLLRDGGFAALRCVTAEGTERRLVATMSPAALARLLAWAALAAGGGVLASALLLLLRSGTRPDGRAARAVALATAAALLFALPWTLQQRNATRFLAPLPPSTASPLALPGPRTLTPGAPLLLAPRVDADARLTASLTLAPDSALDLLVRASLSSRDQGLVVTLSTDPRLPSGLARNLGLSFHASPAPARLATLVPQRTYTLQVEQRGPRTTAWLDGEALGELRDHDLLAGSTALLALAGRADVTSLTIEPLPPAPRGATTLRLWQAGAAGAVLAGLSLLLLCCASRSVAALWCWPLAAGLLPGAPAWAAAAGIGLGALLLPLAPRPGRRVPGLLGGGLVLAAALAVARSGPATIDTNSQNRLTPADVSGPPVPQAYAYARHPLCRRFNEWVLTQTLRGEAPSALRERQVRVLALGSSSTFGYGVPPARAWPMRLEAVLAAAGHDVDVLNGGVPGSTAERLRLQLHGVLGPLRPDVVVVSLSFNDQVHNALFDERAHFAAMTSGGISPLAALGAHATAWWRRWGWRRYSSAERSGRPPSDGLRREYAQQPAARFAASLAGMVAQCRAAGAAVVLVQEPFAGKVTASLLQPYHDAIAALGAELDVPVVDPGPALARLGERAFLDAVHPTPEGHEAVARQVAAALVALAPWKP